MSSHDWFKDAVIYGLHVRAFADSNGDGIGDFDGLTGRLDYLSDLGVTALWLLPFYPSPLRDDGYDIADYRVINPAYGDMRAFRRFMTAAHRRDLKVITELVINHTSDQHDWFQRARHAPPGSLERAFYVWTDDPERFADARVIFQDFETSNWTWDPVAQQYYWHRFYSHQPDLNFENPAVEAAVFAVLEHWLDMGVDGLRLDAVPYLYEKEGTNCENLPETHAALRRLRTHLDTRYEGRMLLAEANQWPEDAAAYFGDGDECHMNFHFPLMPRMFMSVEMENRMPIIDILEQTPVPPGDCQWATFLRNHDELTLEMVTDEERDLMLRAYARDSEMRVNLGIRRRLAPLLGNNRRKIELLNALLFSLPGTPVLYYGDEIGMGDNVYLGDRNGVRTPMQWTADRNAGFSTSNPHRLYLPLIAEQGYHYESINVETQSHDPASLLAWMRQIIALRKRYPVLGRGAIEFLEPENPHVLAFIRTLEGENPMLCVANLSRLAQHVELDMRRFMGDTPVEAFGRSRFAPIGELPYYLTLAPHGFFWFVIEPALMAISGDAPPPLLHGTFDEVLRRKAGLGRALAQWMPSRRWYAGKELTVRDLSIESTVPIVDDRYDVAFVVVRVSFTEGNDHRYAVPMMQVRDQLASTTQNLHPDAVIARLDDEGLLIDAMVLPEGASVVAGAALSRRAHRGRGATAKGAPRRTAMRNLAADPHDVHVLGVEQSNSSAIIGGRLIAKLIRRLEPAENPDVVLPGHLAQVGYRNVPGLAATLEVDLAGDAQPASAVVVHDVVANEGDLWQWMLAELSLSIERRVNSEVTSDDEGDAHISELARLLGRRTAELHAALATTVTGNRGLDPMAPQPFSLLWQRSVLQTLRNGLRATQRAVRTAGRHESPAAAELARLEEATAAVMRSPEETLQRFDALRSRKFDATRIRVHGDLHLGQVLWTGHDVVFIDFEGEPGRPMGERVVKRSPLVDVAGLVRSIDYAGRHAADEAVDRGTVPVGEIEALDRWRRRSTRRTQQELVDTYFAAIAPSGLLPPDRADAELLLDAYILQKGLYEIRYELANRPRWVGWPLSAVAEMIR